MDRENFEDIGLMHLAKAKGAYPIGIRSGQLEQIFHAAFQGSGDFEGQNCGRHVHPVLNGVDALARDLRHFGKLLLREARRFPAVLELVQEFVMMPPHGQSFSYASTALLISPSVFG